MHQLLDQDGDRWIVLGEAAARADARDHAAAVEFFEGAAALGEGRQAGVPGRELLGAEGEHLGGGRKFARREQAGAVGREGGDAAERAHEQVEGGVGAVIASGDEVGHEQGRVAALDVAEALGEEEGALRGREGGEAPGVDDEPVIAVTGVAERGDEGPAVARRGAEEADGGEGQAQQLGDPDDLLQKWQGDGTFGGLQLLAHQLLGDDGPAQLEGAHEGLRGHRLVEPAEAADVDAVGVGDAGHVLLEGAKLPTLHEAAEIEWGAHWSDFSRHPSNLTRRRSKKVPVGTRTSLQPTADLGMPGNERSHGCCQAH
jgi:hypothetical protein